MQFYVKERWRRLIIHDVDLAGGGFTIESGIHYLDQIVYVTGASTVVVGSARAIMFRGLDYELHCATTLGPEQVHVSVLFSRFRNAVNGFVFRFDGGNVTLGLEADASLVVTRTDTNRKEIFDISQRSLEPPVRNVERAFLRFWTLFFEAISAGQPNLTSALGSLTTDWVEQIYRSVRNAPRN